MYRRHISLLRTRPWPDVIQWLVRQHLSLEHPGGDLAIEANCAQIGDDLATHEYDLKVVLMRVPPVGLELREPGYGATSVPNSKVMHAIGLRERRSVCTEDRHIRVALRLYGHLQVDSR
jgi:hypothetical protein